MRRFFDLRQHISSNRPDAHALAESLRHICGAAAALIASGEISVLATELTKKEATQLPTQSDLESITLAIRRSFPTILRGLEKLRARPASSSAIGGAVYEVVVLFEAILSQLSTIAVWKARDMANDDEAEIKAAKTKSRKSKKAALSPSARYHEACQSLAQLAVCMVVTLEPTEGNHSQVLEGCLCAFLDHLGSSLSLAIFTDDQSLERQSIFAGVLPPQGLQDMSDVDSQIAMRAVQVEAPYLIYILDRVMSFIDSHDVLMNARSTSLFSLQKDKNVGNGAFAQKVKEKLQNTLLRGIFGDDDETFRNSLRRPAQSEDDLMEDIDIGTREGTPEWFTSEVWRILGWNILTNDGSF